MRMLRFALGTTMGLSLLALGAVARADDPAPRDLLQKVVDTIPRNPFTAKAKLSSPTRGWVREMELSYKHVDNNDATYLEVTAPMDVKDTRFLLVDHPTGPDEQWIYVPAMKRAIQVSETTRKQPFLGSDFYVSDMVRPDIDAFNYRYLGGEDVGGRHCKLIESTPKNPEKELYSKTVMAIDPTDLVITRTQFFDAKGQLLKVFTIDKLEKIDGQFTPLQQVMKNVQDNTESRLELTEVKFNATIPDEMFRKAYLIR
ncbi:MAG TPA: outer membrane lipoprotein-sorting protein [Candidatus Binatia bacterium]|nr:outer membrane lipoprotein-sorting protein [Candidatus Binatia bacterium]